MSEFSSKGYRDFVYGKPDQGLIRNYRGLKTDEDSAIAATARTLSEKHTDAGEFAKHLVKIQDGIREDFRQRRREMLSSMNYNTILRLAQIFDGMKFMTGESDEAEAKPDTEREPVLARLKEIMSSDWSEWCPAEKERILTTLDEADKRTMLPRPVLPSTLEDALRYSANAPNEQREILVGAFMDFLRSNPLPARADEMNERETVLQECLKTLSKEVDLGRKFKSMDPTGSPILDDPEQRDNQLKLESVQAQLADISAIKEFRENFAPGLEVPAPVERECRDVHELYWSNSVLLQEVPAIDRATQKTSAKHSWENVTFVNKLSMLAWLASEFSIFWHKHGEHYKNANAVIVNKARKRSEKNKNSGEKGRLNREHKRWVTRTKKFVEFQNDEKFHILTTIDLDRLSKQVSTSLRIKDKRTQHKIREFFGTIWSIAKDRSEDDHLHEILDILRNRRVGSLKKITITECLKLLSSPSESAK